MTAHRWAVALAPRPSVALDVLVPVGVIVPRHDDIVGEVVDGFDGFVPAAGDVGLMLQDLKARTPLFDWHEWWAQLTSAVRHGRPRQVEELLAVATLNGFA